MNRVDIKDRILQSGIGVAQSIAITFARAGGIVHTRARGT